jgi:tetratricopeptide (TPR) repeat protein
VIQSATSKTPDAARAELESFLKAGVAEPDLYAVLSEVTNTLGDNDAAFSYATDAVVRAPNVPSYQLNAGVLADKLNRPAAAVQFYEQFLSLFQREPILVDTAVDGVRERVRFLRARL